MKATGLSTLAILVVFALAACSVRATSESDLESDFPRMKYVTFYTAVQGYSVYYYYTFYCATNIGFGYSSYNTPGISMEGQALTRMSVEWTRDTTESAVTLVLKLSYPNEQTLLLQTNISMLSGAYDGIFSFTFPAFIYNFSNRLTVDVRDLSGGREVFHGVW